MTAFTQVGLLDAAPPARMPMTDEHPETDAPMWGWSDPSPKVPVVEKAQQAIDGFRMKHKCDPTFLRVNVVEAAELEAARFDEVEVLACTYVSRHMFYAGRRP